MKQPGDHTWNGGHKFLMGGQAPLALPLATDLDNPSPNCKTFICRSNCILFNHITSTPRSTAWLTVLDEGQPTEVNICAETHLQKFTNIWIFVNLQYLIKILILVWWCETDWRRFASPMYFFTWRLHANTVTIGKYVSYTIGFAAANYQNFFLEKLRFNRIFRN